MRIPIFSKLFKRIDDLETKVNSFKNETIKILNELNKSISNIDNNVVKMEITLLSLRKIMIQDGVRVRIL